MQERQRLTPDHNRDLVEARTSPSATKDSILGDRMREDHVRAKTSPMPIGEAIEMFLLRKRVNNCSIRTVQIYRFWLDRPAAMVSDTATLDSVVLTRFFVALRERGARLGLL